MFYLSMRFGNQYKDCFLPDVTNWTGGFSLLQTETGLDEDIVFSLRILDGQCFMGIPLGFWASGDRAQLREIHLTQQENISLTNGRYEVVVSIAEHNKSSTVFRKYSFPRGISIIIGRGQESDIWYDELLLSKAHGIISRKSDGSCVYLDQSTNASFVNHQRISRRECELRFGDLLFITPNIRLVYLGDVLALNSPSALKHVRLGALQGEQIYHLSEPPAAAETIVPYHRSPRLLTRANVEPLEIEPPLTKQASNAAPTWLTIGPSMTMILPMMMGVVMMQMTRPDGGGSYIFSSLAMMGTSSLLAIGWGLVNVKYRKKTEARTEEARQAIYQQYIAEMQEKLIELNRTEQARQAEQFLSAGECMSLVSSGSLRLWERMPSHSDFIQVRLGKGELPLPNDIQITKQKLSIIDDPLRDEPDRLKAEYGMMRDVPITLSLREERVIGVLGDAAASALIASIVIQISALHSYHDVRMVILTDESQYSQWSWARWLPHVYTSSDRDFRMVVSKPTAVQEVLNHLDEVVSLRRDNVAEDEATDTNEGSVRKRPQPLPHYVVFCLNDRLLENEPVINSLISGVPGMTLVVLSNSMELLPKECTGIVNVRNETPGLFTPQGDVLPLRFERVSLTHADMFSRALSGIRVRDSGGRGAIPTRVSFLEVYNATSVEDLDVWRFWNENHAYEGLQATIGLGPGGKPFVLDISDKFHGPHGLVAGTTGSGKSVMLQTYILSLALNYHPIQVQFILIDYKGGGMANELNGLPHIAGVIDNLQGNRTILRALATIKGEIHRRLSIFKQVGVSNIDEYIRQFNNDPQEEPLNHLIIVVDEFAELKKEQPEFMQELISASRVGRSVGLHLILATQKPSNSVDDEIWSNTRFRVCLRVQSRSDSQEMIHRPEAAYLKGMGRCFVQVGNDEIFMEVQTSWSGADYEPVRTSGMDVPRLLDDAGRPVRRKQQKAKNAEKKTTQMEAVLDHIQAIMRKHGVSPAKKLWMEELHWHLPLQSISAFKETRFHNGKWPAVEAGRFSAVIGLADDLIYQRHLPVYIDFSAHGNHMIVGYSGTGKTTMLQTLAVSLASRYTPDVLVMYVLSLTSRVLKCLESLPHVGDVIYQDENEEILRLLHFLQTENERRRDLFAQASTDNFEAYNQHASTENGLPPIPAMVVMVDRYAQIADVLEDESKDLLYSLFREGSSRGIYFVVTALSYNEIYTRVVNSFHGVALQQHESHDFSEILGLRVPPESADISAHSGRGLAAVEGNVFEMQTAVWGEESSDKVRFDSIEALGAEMQRAWRGARPQRLPRIPKEPLWSGLIADVEKYLQDIQVPMPVGYCTLEGLPYVKEMRTQSVTLVLASRNSDKTVWLQGAAGFLLAQGAEVHVFSKQDWASVSLEGQLTLHNLNHKTELEEYTTGLFTALKERKNLIQSNQRVNPHVVILDGIADAIAALPKQLLDVLADANGRGISHEFYVLAGITAKEVPLVRHQALFRSLCDSQSGILIGGKLSEHDLWDVQADYRIRNRVLTGNEAYLVKDGTVRMLAVPVAL